MIDVLDFNQEARGCLRLAEAETHDELKTILMGMALGWLTLATEQSPGVHALQEPVDEPADEMVAADEPAHIPEGDAAPLLPV